MAYLGTNYLSIPRDKWVVKASQIKELWKDYPEEQRIFPDLISNLEYDKAIIRAVLRFNEEPPIIVNETPLNFYLPRLLLRMSFSEVLSVIINYHASNYFTGSSGGSQAVTHERIDKIQQIRSILESEIDPQIRKEKIMINDNGAYGISSNNIGAYYPTDGTRGGRVW